MSRRAVLGGALVVGAGSVLAACGGGDGGDGGASTDGTGGTATSDGSGPTDGAAAPGGEGIAPVTDVPVGGGVITAGVVVTQPTQGEFRGFSSTCTHQACQVSSVEDGAIVCACHGSRFSVEDGSVVNGPATAPLPEVPVAVEGDEVVRA